MSGYKSDITKKAAKVGFYLHADKNGALIFKNETGVVVRASKTPSCPFAISHIIGDMRRANRTGFARPNRSV